MPMFASSNQTSSFIKSNKSIIPSQARKIPGFIKEQDAGFYSAECVNADEIISAAKLIIANRLKRKTGAMCSPTVMKDFLIMHYADKCSESFCVLFMDNQHRIIDIEELFQGTIDGASVYPREVVKRALELNAAAISFAHNHPSGVPEASEADKFITKRLKEALKVVDIRVLDHFIIAGTETKSFAECGLI